MSRLGAVLGLYRLDVAFITFCAALAGPYFSHGSFALGDVGKASFVSVVLYYYVYALNAITDRREDTVNHPERPLPSGRLSMKVAIIWVAVLALASVAGSLMLFRGNALFLSLLVVFFGTLYSAQPFALKRFPLVAALLTAWGLMHPFFVTADPAIGWRGVVFIPIAAGVVLFKDLADAAGDQLGGRSSMVAVLPVSVLWVVSLFLLAGGGALLWIVDLDLALPLPIALIALIVWHRLFVPLAAWKEVIYTRLIRGALAALALIAFLAIGGMLSW